MGNKLTQWERAYQVRTQEQIKTSKKESGPDTDATASFASDLTFELSVEQVDDDALVSAQMVFPSFSRHFEVRPPVRVLELDVRLHLNAV